MDSFKFKAYVPTLDTYVHLQELKLRDYINIVKYIANNDVEMIISAFDNIIKYNVDAEIFNKLIGEIPSSLNFHDKFCFPENACSIDIELTYGFMKLIFSIPPTLNDQLENGNPSER